MPDPVMPTYARSQLAFTHGIGNWLYDADGNRYLDALAGIAVNTLGHNHPAVSRAVAEQSSRLMHTSNLYRIPLQEELAARLTRLSGMDNVFFANSGAEANETAIKIARLHARKQGRTFPQIIVTEGAFHGRTLATLTATGNRKVQAGFEPLIGGFLRVPFNDLQAVANTLTNSRTISAILVEPIQGEGGVVIPDANYLRGLRELADQQKLLLILDEVQTGNGRTGSYFAYQQTGILPDLVTTAKGLANGVPIGACLARGEAATVFSPGNHGSTFGGNPLACSAALAVLQTLEEEKLIERALVLGERMRQGFTEALAGANQVVEIRGQGLMIGIELNRPCGELVARAQDVGLLINVAAEKVVRLLPPLTLTDEEASLIIKRLSELIRTS